MEEIKSPYDQIKDELKQKSIITLQREFKDIFIKSYLKNKERNKLERSFLSNRMLPSGYFFYLNFPESKNDKFPIVLALENEDETLTCINLNYLTFEQKRIFLNLFYNMFGKTIIKNQTKLEEDENFNIKFTFKNNYDGLKYIIKKINADDLMRKSIRVYDLKKVNIIKFFKVEHLKYLLVYDCLEFTPKSNK